MQRYGFTNAYANWTLWESRIGRLATIGDGGFWNGNGQFQDNHGMDKTSPHAYDAFADGYVAFLGHSGYANNSYLAPGASYAYSDFLNNITRRAAYTHALFQGPWGEIPVGGRSGQHYWNEALMAAQYELATAAAVARGDSASACVFQRAAHLSHASGRRWFRSDGKGVQILKNLFLNVTERWGFEGYSFFSQYSIMPMGWLGLAFQVADAADSVQECSTPADVGGVAFALPYASFRKVFANAQGTYVEIMTGADPEYDSTGFYRVHFNGCALTPPAGSSSSSSSSSSAGCSVDSLLGPTAAPPLNAGAPTGIAAAIGGAWWTFPGDDNTTRRSLANHTLDTVTAAVFTPGLTNTPAGVAFSVQYVLWGDGVLVTEAYTVTPAGVTCTSSISLPGSAALFALLADAASASAVATNVPGKPTLLRPASRGLQAALEARDEAAFHAAAGVRFGSTSAPIGAGAGAPLPTTFASFGLQFPVLTFDGTNNYTVTVDANSTTVAGDAATQGGVRYAVEAPPGRAMDWAYDPSVWAPSRNGVMSVAYAGITATTAAPSLTFTVTPIPATASAV
jgi:hypothetical protein